MPLDPQIVTVMEAVAALGLPANNEVSPEEARANGRARPRAPGPDVGKVEDRTIPGPDGEIPVRIYTRPVPAPFPAWPGTTAAAGSSATWTPPTRRPAISASAPTASSSPLTTAWPRKPSSPAPPRIATPLPSGWPPTPPP